MERIKFYYNGIKVNGGKLIKCWYSLDNNATNSEQVSIYAKEYQGILPRELKPINNTDIRTDYFEKDHTRLFPNSRYYKAARAAALVTEIKDRKKALEIDKKYYIERGLEFPQWIYTASEKIARYEAEQI